MTETTKTYTAAFQLTDDKGIATPFDSEEDAAAYASLAFCATGDRYEVDRAWGEWVACGHDEKGIYRWVVVVDTKIEDSEARPPKGSPAVFDTTPGEIAPYEVAMLCEHLALSCDDFGQDLPTEVHGGSLQDLANQLLVLANDGAEMGLGNAQALTIAAKLREITNKPAPKVDDAPPVWVEMNAGDLATGDDFRRDSLGGGETLHAYEVTDDSDTDRVNILIKPATTRGVPKGGTNNRWLSLPCRATVFVPEWRELNA